MLDSSVYAQISKYDQRLMSFFEQEGRGVIKTERFISLSQNINHMLINYVTFPKFQFEAVLNLFKIFVKQTGFRFLEIG